MPDNEAPVRAFYDHEIEEPRTTSRRRRPVADWGVGEDVFDRLPSRRFTRTERRGEGTSGHRHAPRFSDAPPRARHDELSERRDAPAHDLATGPATTGRDGSGARGETPVERRNTASRGRRRPAPDWLAEVTPRPAGESPALGDPDGRRSIAIDGALQDELAPDDAPRRGRTIAIDGALQDELAPDDAPRRGRTMVVGGALEEELAADDAPRQGGTVVVGGAQEHGTAPTERAARRTIVISGHPDRLPAPRTRRPPRGALERVGASPDRIAAYAVALGLLLILIAVLTTSH